MKKGAVVGVFILILTGVLGVCLYLHHIHSPKHSLLQVKKAFDRHDVSHIKKYVDAESVAESLADQILEFEINQGQKPQNPGDLLGRASGQGMSVFLKPQLTSFLKKKITNFVETGKFGKRGKGEMLPPEIQKRMACIEGIRGVAYVKKKGNFAYAGLNLFDKRHNTTLILELKMKNKDGYWQVVGITNLNKLLQELDRLEERRVAALNRLTAERMKKTLVLKGVHIKEKTITSAFADFKRITFDLTFQNDGKKAVKEYEAVLICKTPKGKKLGSFFIKDTRIIYPGKTCEKTLVVNADKYDVFGGGSAFYETPQSDIKTFVKIKRIKFTDGEELKMHKKWED